ncbi:MAG: fatty acid desaturase [Acidimicrobiaceae bacterium]|nr:fatty acid desaturase [Acidimicrobiaceae bacterium]
MTLAPPQIATEARAPSDYRRLSEKVRTAGLLKPRTAYYRAKCVLTGLALVAGWVGFFLVGNSWATLGIAVYLGVAFTQTVMLGHDAGHQQIFNSRDANRRFGLVVANLLAGMAFGWWVPKHNAHHAHPNELDQDPDVGAGIIAFSAEVADSRHGAARSLARRQAFFFFPILLLQGIGLHYSSVQNLYRRRDRSALIEAGLIAMHAAAFLAVAFSVLSPLRAIAFLVVQQGVFGLYLGCTFAPNHKGMPMIPEDSDLCFASRQIITSRNIRGGRFVNFVLGGLNYQIEHHLFPCMARPNLARAKPIVRQYCAEQGLPYCEDSLVGSYLQVLRHLNAIGSGSTSGRDRTEVGAGVSA